MLPNIYKYETMYGENIKQASYCRFRPPLFQGEFLHALQAYFSALVAAAEPDRTFHNCRLKIKSQLSIFMMLKNVFYYCKNSEIVKCVKSGTTGSCVTSFVSLSVRGE